MQETMLQNRKPVIRSYWLVGACIAVGFIASICIGNYPISIREIISILTGGEVGAMTRKVFFTLRLPRTCMGVMAGAGLGVAGSVYQMIFRNPLASPDIIGVSSGANLGAAIAIVSVGIGVGGIALGAFAGGLLAVAFVMLLVRATRANTTATYVLAGIVISAVAKSVIMLLKYYADSESNLAAIEYWTMGSFAGVTASKVLSILPFWLIGFVGLFLLHRQVGLLSLNEEECRTLGVRLSGKADGAYPFYPAGRLNRQHYGADLLYRAHRPTHRAHDDKTGKYRYYGAFRHGGRCRNAGSRYFCPQPVCRWAAHQYSYYHYWCAGAGVLYV